MSINDNLSIKKKILIENLINKGISNQNIINALTKVKRENFVLNEYLERAYDDNALPILDDQTISQPYTVAFMLDLLDLKKGQKVLEIGTGSGYLTAILVEMGANVYSIERSKILYDSSKEKLTSLGYSCNLKYGDGTDGWREFEPYDRVIISAASPNFPYYLSNQISDNSIIICPVGDKNSQTMIKGIFRISSNDFILTEHDKFRFVPLIGKNAWNE